MFQLWRTSGLCACSSLLQSCQERVSPARDAMSPPGDGDQVPPSGDRVIITLIKAVFHLQDLDRLFQALWRQKKKNEDGDEAAGETCQFTVLLGPFTETFSSPLPAPLV